MSYGFYKMPPRSSHEDYLVKVAGKTHIAIAFDLGVEHPPLTAVVRTDRKVTVVMTQVQELDYRAQGYSGDVCTNCQGVRLRWAGHCQVCDDCGTTTGCS